MNKRRWIAGGVSLTVLVGGLVFLMANVWSMFDGPFNTLQIDLAKPDAWIRTKSLARLPRDLLQVPIAKDVLTEDFVFYYEQNEDRLGIKGSLRRIAYEHDLNWEDRLVETILDEPAEVALWRDQKGSLRYYLIAMTRNQLSKLVQQAATVVLGDKQLKVATTVRVGGDSVTVFALTYGNDKTLLFATRGNRAVVMSHPGMLLNAKNRPNHESEKVLRNLLGADTDDQAMYAKYFAAGTADQAHSMILSTNFLSFGYQHFFPGFEALRFDFSSSGTWATRVLFDGKRLAAGSLNDKSVWDALPINPSACALLPIDWKLGQSILGKGLKTQEADTLLAQLDGPAAVCWYAQSHLHTPVFVAQLKPGAAADRKIFDALYRWSIRAPGSAAAQSEVKASQRKDGSSLWQRAVDAPFGIHGAKDNKDYLPTLALKGRVLVFSPDDQLVSQTLAALDKRFPNMADTLPKQAVTLGIIVPKKLSEMASQEVFEVLPAQDEEIFSNAAQKHLLPRLAAMKKYPPYRLALANPPQGQQRQWQTVEWQALPAK